MRNPSSSSKGSKKCVAALTLQVMNDPVFWKGEIIIRERDQACAWLIIIHIKKRSNWDVVVQIKNEKETKRKALVVPTQHTWSSSGIPFSTYFAQLFFFLRSPLFLFHQPWAQPVLTNVSELPRQPHELLVATPYASGVHSSSKASSEQLPCHTPDCVSFW